MKKILNWMPVILTLASQYAFTEAYMIVGFILSGIDNIWWIATTEDRRMKTINGIFLLINLKGLFL